LGNDGRIWQKRGGKWVATEEITGVTKVGSLKRLVPQIGEPSHVPLFYNYKSGELVGDNKYLKYYKK